MVRMYRKDYELNGKKQREWHSRDPHNQGTVNRWPSCSYDTRYEALILRPPWRFDSGYETFDGPSFGCEINM